MYDWMRLKKLKTIRKQSGETQAEVADAIDVPLGTYRNWEQLIHSPRTEELIKLANYFGVPTDSFFDRENRVSSGAVRINVYGTVPAGVALEAIEDIDGWEEIPQEWTIGGREYMGLTISGDSMSPKYLDGDVLIIQIQPDCYSGQDAVVFVNGHDATFKRVQKDNEGILLKPINPNYEARFYRYDDAENPITVLGIAKEVRRKIKTVVQEDIKV